MSDRRILASSAIMAAGTIVSRLSGLVRSVLLVAALGSALRADLFSIANTLPNMVYILLAGGIFNAVLVPQLVRRISDDADGGDAYASRVVTLAALFLGAVSIVLVVVAPLLLKVYLDADYLEPRLASQLESIVDLTRWCLPQVFFYGMYVLVGQILNARGSFGPMMWAPIANNVISVGMLLVYLVLNGTIGDGPEQYAALSTGQEVLLGVGSTLGIAAQLVVVCRSCAGPASPTDRASTSATPSSSTPSRWACGPSSSSSSPRRRTSSSSASPPAARRAATPAPATPSTPTACSS